MNGLKQAMINIALTFSILFVLYLTMIPHGLIGTGNWHGGPVHHFNVNMNPLNLFDDFRSASMKYFIIDDLGNVLLFLPFGCMLTLKYPYFKFLHLVFMGALFSSIIECIQLFLPNRTTDINDVILNTIGTVAGYLLFRFVEKDEEKQQVNKRSDHSV
ncbi:VanZ family protein [Sporolactobacillus inulinus]|uniref:Teicoplanin resistance protein vanZ n=1 Tax=Sporolactobacillus inulinus TaxID=2078 RepID=A0A4Y1ZFV3_9BACL|nr:VanZ family protein [Sporolactobacillus inulinus]GAY78046.1 teicoplanin resistance protein vanZ [Sporolactobacillus inulinus]GEB76291.1 hypothetical protein SIN01_06360 [Sporolactobacillus inulinus]